MTNYVTAHALGLVTKRSTPGPDCIRKADDLYEIVSIALEDTLKPGTDQ